MSELLSLRSVSGGYTRAPILHDIHLCLADEFVGLLGANGAGKSSLLRAVSGHLKVWNGAIEIAGSPVRRLSPWKRAALGVAHVPEGRHVFTAMTVRDNLDVAGLVSGRTAAASRRDEVFTLFPRLAQRQAQVAGSLSGGEQQMLAIGRALMTSPRILLVDEMTAGLAPIVARQLVAALVEIRKAGVGVLAVEQSPHLIADMVDRVYVLEQGRVVRQGKLDELGGADALAELYLGVQSASHASARSTAGR